MNLIVAGTNHKYSPIELREKISFSRRRLKDALTFLGEEFGLKSAVIVSTCNRVELYAACKDAQDGLNKIEDFLSIYHEIDRNALAPHLYRYSGSDALRHLFEVASGLDSQVLGETQVMGQVRYFYEEAKRYSYTDDLLDGAFNTAIEVGKRARLETRISEGHVSIGSAAITLIKEKAKNLRDKKVLIIGLGKISNLVIKYLSEEKANSIIVSNRTYDTAVKIAESIGGRAIRFKGLKENLKDVDIIISATASPHVILKKEDIIKIANGGLLIIDLALPRDVDPDVKDIEGVRLFNLDDLESVVEKNIEKRKLEAVRAKAIVEEEVKRLWERLIESEREQVRLP